MQATTVNDFRAALSSASGGRVLAITSSSPYFALQTSLGTNPRELRLHVSGEIGAVLEAIVQGAVSADPMIVRCESEALAEFSAHEGADGIEYLSATRRSESTGYIDCGKRHRSMFAPYDVYCAARINSSCIFSFRLRSAST